MLETLRLEDLTIQLAIVTDGAEDDMKIKSSVPHTYYVPLNEFVQLRTEVRNTTCEPLHPLSYMIAEPGYSARQLPLVLDIKTTRETPTEHVLFQEPHSDIHLGITQSNSDRREIGMCFLASGEYNFVATVRHAGFDIAEVVAMVRSQTAEITVFVE